MKDHEIAALVNQLRDVATQYAGTEQLRAQIALVIAPRLRALQHVDTALAQDGRLESKLEAAGVFKGSAGLRGLLDSQEFWDEQPYTTRLYFGSGNSDYLHRDVLRTAIKLLDGPNTSQTERDSKQHIDAADHNNSQQMTVPDGYVLMPVKLSAENGAKAALSGEFTITREATCPACQHDEADEDCDVCCGKIQYTEHITVPWGTIKEVYESAVRACSLQDSPQ